MCFAQWFQFDDFSLVESSSQPHDASSQSATGEVDRLKPVLFPKVCMPGPVGRQLILHQLNAFIFLFACLNIVPKQHTMRHIVIGSNICIQVVYLVAGTQAVLDVLVAHYSVSSEHVPVGNSL